MAWLTWLTMKNDHHNHHHLVLSMMLNYQHIQLQMHTEQPTLLSTVKSRHLAQFGHIARMDGKADT